MRTIKERLQIIFVFMLLAGLLTCHIYLNAWAIVRAKQAIEQEKEKNEILDSNTNSLF